MYIEAINYIREDLPVVFVPKREEFILTSLAWVGCCCNEALASRFSLTVCDIIGELYTSKALFQTFYYCATVAT